jgi:hypothetical protein
MASFTVVLSISYKGSPKTATGARWRSEALGVPERGLACLLNFRSAVPSFTPACTCQSLSMRRSGKSLLRSGSRFMTSPWRGLTPFCENVDTRLRRA